jgi:hypothetical protein
MLKHALSFFVMLGTFTGQAQQVQVEFDKNTDFSPYKTFRFGECAVITPKDQRQLPDSTVQRIISRAIAKELESKGMQKADDSANMVVTYIAGMQQLSVAGSVGPLGVSPSDPNQTYLRDYQQGNLVIDLNDSHNNKLLWRVKGINSTGGALDQVVDRIVGHGFKKFSLKPKKTKKK